MGELPSITPPRDPLEKAADAAAMQSYFRVGERQQPIRYLLEDGKLVPVVPGSEHYKRALPSRFDRETGMPIMPNDPAYENAAENSPGRFRKR